MEPKRLLSPFNRSKRVDLILQKAAEIQNKGLYGRKSYCKFTLPCPFSENFELSHTKKENFHQTPPLLSLSLRHIFLRLSPQKTQKPTYKIPAYFQQKNR